VVIFVPTATVSDPSTTSEKARHACVFAINATLRRSLRVDRFIADSSRSLKHHSNFRLIIAFIDQPSVEQVQRERHGTAATRGQGVGHD
jgi:hypothetical protein